MQAEVVETWFEIDRVGGSNPYRRAISGLAPHTQGTEALVRIRQIQLAKNTRQQLLRLRLRLQVRTR